MKQDRKTRHVNVNTFEAWANFMLRGFVGDKSDEYRYREDNWDDETSAVKNDVSGELKKTK